MKTLKKSSWKTTTTAILAVLITGATAAKALLDDDPSTVPNWELVVGAVVIAVGLFFARDNDKKSEDVGAGR